MAVPAWVLSCSIRLAVWGSATSVPRQKVQIGGGMENHMKDKEIGRVKNVVNFLQGEKYAAPNQREVIKKSKIYGDVKRGVFKVEDANRIMLSEVQKYIHQARLVKLEGNSQQLDYLNAEEKRARIDAYRAREAKAMFELEREQGKYIPRGKWLAELIGKLSAAKLVALNVAKRRAPDLITAVGGDHKKETVFIELFTSWIEDGFNDLAGVPELNFAISSRKGTKDVN